jgi:tRNA threonylcarbamoyladenosine biosynthesis protein TsaB
MNLLSIDTATEQCSVALSIGGIIHSREVPTARSHADMILPMIDELLRKHQITLSKVDGLAFGRGPGSFTGVRIAVSVAQGLAFANRMKVVGISNLAAIAQQVVKTRKLVAQSSVLVCMDARMQEVYWGVYQVQENGLVRLRGEERVSSPAIVGVSEIDIAVGVGTGWSAYPGLRASFPELPLDDTLLPRAIEIAELGSAQFALGLAVDAVEAQPVYLRDQVVALPKR